MPENPTTEIAVPKSVASRACFASHLGAMAMERSRLDAYIQTVKHIGVERIVALADKSPPTQFSAEVHSIAERLGVVLPVGKDDGEDGGSPPPYVNFGGTAIIPVSGVMTKQPSSLQSAFGGSSTVGMRKALSLALADASVQRVMFHVDSPGGTVDGTGDLGDDIYAARNAKPIASFIEDAGASGAYWIASQTQRIYSSPNSQLIGSIGVRLTVHDTSEAYAKEGVKVHVIASTPGKGALVDGVPITKEALAKAQGIVDAANESFLGAVARGRRVSVAAAKKMAGDADIYDAKKALSLGLIDQVASFGDALSGFADNDKTMGRKAAGRSGKPEVGKKVSLATRTPSMPDDDSDMTAQLATLRAEVAEQKKVADTDRAARIAAEAKLTGNDQLIATLKQELTATSETAKRLESERAATEATAAVSKAVADGRIATESTDYWATFYVKHGKEDFAEAMKNVPVSTLPVRAAKAVATLAGSQPTAADREAVEKAMAKVF